MHKQRISACLIPNAIAMRVEVDVDVAGGME